MHRYTLLRLLIFLFFLVLGAMLLYELDLHYYQAAKNDHIIQLLERSPQLRVANPSDVTERLLAALSDPTPASRRLRLDELATHLRGALEAPSLFYRVEIVDADGAPLVAAEAPDRFAAQNRFPDALFLDTFSRRIRSTLALRDPPRTLGTMWTYYTTPPDDPAIQAMTRRFLGLALMLLLLVLLPFFLIDRMFLHPYERVVRALESAVGEAHPILRPVDSALVRRYDDLARDATLRRLEQEFLDPDFHARGLDEAILLGEVPGRLRLALGYDAVWGFLAGRRPPQGWEVAPLDVSPGTPAPPPPPPGLLDHLRASLPPADGPAPAPRLLPPFVARAAGAISGLLLPLRARPDQVLLLAIAPPAEAALGGGEWERATAQRILTSLDGLFRHYDLLRDQLARQRSEANVSLARNLGHDLTNAIATTRLDLGALASLAERGPDHLRRPGQWDLFAEAVASLRNNVHAMQEIVNIYRSFSFLRRPRFEECDIDRIVDEVLEVLLLSSSLDVRVERERLAAPRAARLEPRLLKLALFNLLTNALDALKRRDTLARDGRGAFAGAPFVRVATRQDSPLSPLLLVVEDNGPGFRDAEGSPLPDAQLDRLFSVGYTTKSGDSEGLGLNWVWTIVHDIHGGTIRPERVEPHGARFVIELATPPSSPVPPPSGAPA